MEVRKIKRPLVVIESPYKAKINGMVSDNEVYVAYAKQCLAHSLSLGEAPFASHLLYTQVLNDNIPLEREEGIASGLAWLEVADKHVFYIDHGISEGMFEALQLTLEKINTYTQGLARNFPMLRPPVLLEFRKIL